MNFSKLRLLALGALLAAPTSVYSHVPAHPESPIHPLAEMHKGLELYTKGGVFDKINHTRTKAGANALRERLESPITEVATLVTRQNAIEYVRQSPDLQTQLGKILAGIAFLESSVRSNSVLDQKILNKLYFTWPLLKNLNESPFALTALACTYPVLDFIPVATHTIMPLLGSYLGIQHRCGHKHHNHSEKKHSHTKHATQTNTHVPRAGLMINALKYTFVALTALHAKEIATAPIQWYNTPGRYTELEIMHKRLQGIAHRLMYFKQLYHAIENHPDFVKNLEHWEHFKNLATKTNISAELKQLLELLESDTFKGKFSRFIQAGNILVAYKLMQQVSQECMPANKALGEIDLYLNCAELVQKQGYCYAQYVTSEKPFIEAKNFSHPFVTKDVVKNSITLQRNALFSGPSTSGKSTALKSIGLAYLGQTLGIASAESLTMTPFDVIAVLRDIKDNTQENRSKFENVALKLHAILTQARECQAQNKRMFVILDDGIDGINNKAQEAIICNFLNDLLPLPNVVVVAATHCLAATEVANNPACECKNYTFVNHQMVPGVGQFETATELLEQKHPELRALLRARA